MTEKIDRKESDTGSILKKDNDSFESCSGVAGQECVVNKQCDSVFENIDPVYKNGFHPSRWELLNVFFSDFWKYGFGKLSHIYTHMYPNEFAEYCQFYILYLAEMHPVDGWVIGGDEISTCYKQPKTMKERLNIVKALQEYSPVTIPYLVDLIDNGFNAKYDAIPERLFVLENKKFSYVGGPGPFKFIPEELKEYLTKRFKASALPSTN
ncbi:thyroxine 5'-deiodinase [Heterostelium album PN500]|uniref:Thyroxine 5'-deiodinase n=1 Tax=Heterostelium pallidum (strain ATCC 26659 / Pp 5 / PN500) TaxID=670386 RepID=D3BVN1_HETP5|nr:thyroxine 5'-deiodinase [Heterostelium album PN500]EFA74534.1 thyroxine 5'-deiodinase [Heterostelium album PN500]|eukprot:XP_020426668.1 thyroxine 5'-deiodinase [Heterostelium album PN500]